LADVTRILSQLDQGDPHAAAELLPLVYDELRKLASSKMAQEKSGQTLQATALVHEAYLRLVHSEDGNNWKSRGHFFAAAAEAMRRILIDQARRKKTVKAGGEFKRIELPESDLQAPAAAVDLLSLDDALKKLAALDPRKARLVELRFFAGLTLPESAQALGVSEATADSDWAYAKAFLRVEMHRDSTK
jgi:RNA polymerase sigma factor (TIGR02999 family)